MTTPPPLAPDLIDRLRSRFADHPLHRALGIEFVSLGPDRCSVAIGLHELSDNGSGTIHGGVLAILADAAVAGALSTNFDGRMGFATSHLSLQFLRRARGRVTASAEILKKGSKVCAGRVDIVDAEGRLVAVAAADFVLTTSKLPHREPDQGR